jgi:hypothetical protein
MAEHVFRTHDDNDGNKEEGIHIILGDDGDFFLYINDSPESLRFRMPVIGGGKSPNTWFALRHLFNAVQEDNNHNKRDEQLDLPLDTDNATEEAIKNNFAKNKINQLLKDFDDIQGNPDLIKERLNVIKNIL